MLKALSWKIQENKFGICKNIHFAFDARFFTYNAHLPRSFIRKLLSLKPLKHFSRVLASTRSLYLDTAVIKLLRMTNQFLVDTERCEKDAKNFVYCIGKLVPPLEFMGEGIYIKQELGDKDSLHHLWRI